VRLDKYSGGGKGFVEKVEIEGRGDWPEDPSPEPVASVVPRSQGADSIANRMDLFIFLLFEYCTYLMLNAKR
jgi:hypothetical protein